MTYPISLSGLSTREQIADTIIRACLGIDSNNKALWESAWAHSPEFSMGSSGEGKIQGLEALNKAIFDRVGPMDTQHLITNIRIDVEEGADTAHMTAMALAQHYRAGQGREADADFRLGGAAYDMQVVREDGQWKLKSWVGNGIWSQGTRAVFQPAIEEEEKA